jgi:hypothetical protein
MFSQCKELIQPVKVGMPPAPINPDDQGAGARRAKPKGRR